MSTPHPTDDRPFSPEIWDAIPDDIGVDLDAVQARGRQRRRRRRAMTASVTVASFALIGAVTWTVATSPLSTPVEPATGIVDTGNPTPSDTGSPATSDPTSDPTTVEPPTQSTDDDPAAPNADDDAALAPRLQVTDIEQIAAATGLTIDRSFVERNMLDALLVDPSGAQITITVTTADSVADALSHAIADRPYDESTIAGSTVYHRPAPVPGESDHWLTASSDGTQMISVSALPPGTAADGRELPAGIVDLVEADILPAILAA
ncbi:hypothetical protein [Occultella kanbiaonis]|uniref:hypothetical protein n=1 Tax=Occultella kanbiaonis TaxID=2675754 RepID=UPI0012B74B73|nr:hypothetical protein [Occultella kanbiaonis]